MDFKTARAIPYLVTIDGTEYKVPRFLQPQLEAWAAEVSSKKMDEALEKLEDDNAKAHFQLYYEATPIDVMNLLQSMTTPPGEKYVIRTSFKAAGVPDEQTEAVIANSDPIQLRNLVNELSKAKQAIDQMKEESGDKGTTNPLAEPPRT